MMKADLCMWTFNGEATLGQVLRQINRVVPFNVVNKRFIVDDHSEDKTRKIAKFYQWDVIFNEGKGISDGANTALKHIESEYFISFEQDLLLAKDWWLKIPQYLAEPNVAVASGMRVCKGSGFGLETFAKIEEFAFERYRKAQEIGKLDLDKFLYGKTLDNTIYKTEAIRKISGFPKPEISAGVDNLLAYHIHLAGYKWIVDYNVKSDHLRKNFRDELNHRFWYGICFDGLGKAFGIPPINLKRQILRFLFSPIRGLQVGMAKKDLRATYVYPLIRLYVIRGIVHSRKKARMMSK